MITGHVNGIESMNDDGLAPIDHLAIIQRLCDMPTLDRTTARKIGNRARHPQYPVISAG